MTLKDLKDIDFDLPIDYADDEIDTTVYFDLADINDITASKIRVVGIGKHSITCKFTDFLRKINFRKIQYYIEDNYYDGETKNYLLQQLSKREVGDITDDGGEALYHFITNDIADFFEYLKDFYN